MRLSAPADAVDRAAMTHVRRDGTSVSCHKQSSHNATFGTPRAQKRARRAAFTSPSFPRGLLTHFRFDCFQRLCTANAHVVRMLLETFNQFTAPWSDARTYLLLVGLTVRKRSTTFASGSLSRKRD